MAWEDVKELFRPDAQMGVMKIDEEACTSCGLCIENCVFRCWEMAEDGKPHLKEGYACFSCFNCMVVCPVDAVSIVETYHVRSGPFARTAEHIPVRMPIEPRDANGNLSEWNAVERLILERRSVRNFRNTPVPKPIIRRILEAGRFAPSGMNAQPWRFIVVTNKALLKEIGDFIPTVLEPVYNAYVDDEKVKELAAAYEADPARNPAVDPRAMLGGYGTFGRRIAPTLWNAPVLIYFLTNGSPMAIGIAGQNMSLVARSLGIGSCWVGFASRVTASPVLMKKLGIAPPWSIASTMVFGYPKFKQEGLVPREYRPVTWIEEGSEEQIID